jgi:hypothetical protein
VFTAWYELILHVNFVLTLVSKGLNMYQVEKSGIVFIEPTVGSSNLRPRKREKLM